MPFYEELFTTSWEHKNVDQFSLENTSALHIQIKTIYGHERGEEEISILKILVWVVRLQPVRAP
jgi:hypothetical protein